MVSQSSDENFDKIAVSLLSTFTYSYTLTSVLMHQTSFISHENMAADKSAII
jgi:hypothetical protein